MHFTNIHTKKAMNTFVWSPTLFLFVVQSEAAKEVSEKQKKDLDVLKGLDLSQFSIRGSEEDWDHALSSGKPAGLVSVKRSVAITCTFVRMD